MKKFILFLASIAFLSPSLAFSVTPQEGLARLLQGNDRFVHDKLEHPDRTLIRREAVVAKQSPFAIIVACSDSRVSPEIIFDQGVGDLFVIRVAGNVIGDLELDSIDYAALYLNSSIILVFGHQNCGAVNAVLQGTTKDIEAVAKLIAPSVEEVQKAHDKDVLASAIKANAIHMRDYLKNSRVLKNLVDQKKIEIYAGYYHLTTGKVEILNP